MLHGNPAHIEYPGITNNGESMKDNRYYFVFERTGKWIYSVLRKPKVRNLKDNWVVVRAKNMQEARDRFEANQFILVPKDE